MQQITLSALTDFKCLGADCPDNCCTGWDIKVDEQTVLRWRELPDSALRSKLLSNLIRNENPGAPSYHIARKDSPVCPYFDSDRLCVIQKTLGHEMLSATCRDYPRLTLQGQGFEIHSMQLSCPESARLILFPAGSYPLFQASSKPEDRRPDPLGNFFMQLESLLHSERHIPISKRLLFIAKTLAHLATGSESGGLTPNAVTDWTNRLKNDLEKLATDRQTNTQPSSPGLVGWFWHTYASISPKLLESLSSQAVTQTPLRRLLTDPILEKVARFTAIEKILHDSRERIAGVLNPFGGAWENHLLVSLLNNGFPRNPVSGNHIASLIAAVYPVAIAQLLFKMHVLGNIPVTPESIVNLVYKIERQLSSNNRIYEFLDNNRALLRIDQYWECFDTIFPA